MRTSDLIQRSLTPSRYCTSTLLSTSVRPWPPTTAPRRRIEHLTEHVFDPNSSTAESYAY